MRRFFISALVALSVSPVVAYGEVCLSGASEGWGPPAFRWCDVFDDIRLAFSDDDYGVKLDSTPDLDGDSDTGPVAQFGIEVSPRKVPKSWPSEDRITLLNTALADRVCRSDDLGRFVVAGGRVIFDMFVISQVQENPLDMSSDARKLVSSITVATCEAN